MPTFGTRTPGDVPYLGNPSFLAHGYNCLWFYVPGMCHWFHLVFFFFFFFGRTIPDLLGSDLMTTMVTLGVYLRGGLWKCHSWLFLFSLMDCQFSGYLYCVSCYLCGVLVVPCVFSFLLFVVFERCFLDYSLHQF